MLDALLGAFLAEEGEEGFAFEVEEVPFADFGGAVVAGAAAEDAGEFAADDEVVVGDVATFVHAVQGALDGADGGVAHGGDVLAGGGLHVAGGQGEHLTFGVTQDVVLVHGDGVGVAQEPELAGFEGAGGDLGGADEFEGALHGGQQGGAELLAGLLHVGEAQQHFLGAAAAGDEAHADFDEAHVQFCTGDDVVGVQGEFRAAAEGQAEGRGDGGVGAEAQRGGDLLELFDHVVQFVPFFSLGLREDQGEVRSGAEVLALVADHEAGVAHVLHELVGVLHGAQLVFTEGVHLGVPFGQQHAVAEVDDAGSGAFLDDLGGVFFQVGEDEVRRFVLRGLAFGGDGLVARVEGVPAGLFHGGQQRGQGAALGFQVGDDGLHAQGVHGLEGTLFPAEAPLEGVVDVLEAVADVAGHLGGVPEAVVHDAAQELAFLAFSGVQGFHAGGEGLALDGVHGGDLDAALVLVLEGVEVQVQDLGLAVCALRFLVEAAAGLVAQHLLLFDQGAEGGREGEVLVVGGGLTEVAGDVVDDVQAREVGGAEGGAAGAAQRGAGQLVDLRGGQSSPLHVVHGADDAVHADAVGDEARHVVRDDDALAEGGLRELAEGLGDLRVGLGGGDDFQQVQVAGRVEEVRAHEAALEVLAAALDLEVHGDAAGVAADDRGFLGDLLHAFPQAAFGVEFLDDRLEDPVGVLEVLEVVFEVAGRDQGGAGGVHEGGGAGLEGALDAGLGQEVPVGVVRQDDVQQHHGNPGVGELRGDGGTHHARADNGSFLYLHATS